MSEIKHILTKESAKALVKGIKQNFSPISHAHEKSDIADLDILESLALANQAAIEANTSALKAVQTDIEALAAQLRANEENLKNFIAISSDEVNALF